jgi:hypothetical protein
MSYLDFTETASTSKKTGTWRVSSGPSGLGTIAWYAPWRRYCFYPNAHGVTVLDSGCLGEIRVFLDEMTAAQKQSWKGAIRGKPGRSHPVVSHVSEIGTWPEGKL